MNHDGVKLLPWTEDDYRQRFGLPRRDGKNYPGSVDITEVHRVTDHRGGISSTSIQLNENFHDHGS